jgi:hypothetical protein
LGGIGGCFRSKDVLTADGHHGAQLDSETRKPQVRIKRLEAQLRKEKLMERVAELDPILAAELRAADALLDAYKSNQGTQACGRTFVGFWTLGVVKG